MACLAYFHRVSKEKSAITSAKHWRKTFRSDPSEGSGDKKIFQPSVSNCSSRWRYIVTFYRKTKKLKPKTNLFLQITEKMRFRYITKGKLPASYLYFSGYEDGRSNSVKYRQFQIIYIPKKQKTKKKTTTSSVLQGRAWPNQNAAALWCHSDLNMKISLVLFSVVSLVKTRRSGSPDCESWSLVHSLSTVLIG